MAIDLEVASKDYFSNLSALAKKISVDVENTQDAYQEYWHSLSKKDQDEVINESIISPSAVIKYSHLPSAVIKDNPNTHSWFTKSQLDLFNQNQCNLERRSNQNGNLETMNQLEQSNKIMCNQKLALHKGKDGSNEKNNTNKLHKQSVLKPKIPPPPPPTKNRVSNIEMETFETVSVESASADIPKTGFDFLDNW